MIYIIQIHMHQRIVLKWSNDPLLYAACATIGARQNKAFSLISSTSCSLMQTTDPVWSDDEDSLGSRHPVLVEENSPRW